VTALVVTAAAASPERVIPAYPGPSDPLSQLGRLSRLSRFSRLRPGPITPAVA